MNREIARAKLAASRSRANSSSSCNSLPVDCSLSQSSRLPRHAADHPPAITHDTSPSYIPDSRRRCCKCCQAGRCVRCSCVTSGRPCVDCYPSRSGACSNLSQHSTTAMSQRSTRPLMVDPLQLAPAASSSSCNAIPNDTPEASLLSPAQGELQQQLQPAPSPIQPSSSAPSCAPTQSQPNLPSFSSIFSAKPPTLHHIPKGARDIWSVALSSSLNAITTCPSDLDSWKRLFMLPSCILCAPADSRLQWRVITQKIKNRLARWSNDDIPNLWAEVLSLQSQFNSSRRGRKRQSTPDHTQKIARRASRAAEDGQYHKAVQLLQSEGLAPPSESTKEALLAKHPNVPLPPAFPTPTPPSSSTSESIVQKALNSFPKGTAPGPSGLRHAHLAEALSCPSPSRGSAFLSNLSSFVNLLLSGDVPSPVRPYICCASLVAIKKKNGGIRPIAVGEIFRRLTSKCLCHQHRSHIVNILSPLQVGVCVPNGCEAIVHSVNDTLQNNSIPADNKWTLLVDFSNAFNNIDRLSVLKETRSQIPSLSAWMESCYGGESPLFFGEHVIPSRCGVHQGDPLGPLGFALGLHPLIEEISREVPGLIINSWYLDDGTLCGSPSDLLKALSIIESKGASRGLVLNRSKCLVHIPPSSCALNPLPTDIPTCSDGFVLLGCPIGPPSFCNSFTLDLTKSCQNLTEKLSLLQDSHIELSLLRSCLSFSKIGYILRTCPPSYIKDATIAFDELISVALSDIIACPISPWSLSKAFLPISLSGIGLRRASIHSPAAYLGSSSQSAPLVSKILGHEASSLPTHLQEAFESLSSYCQDKNWASLDDVDVPLLQRHLSRAVDENSYASLLSSSPDSRSRALALSSSIPHAGDWLKAVPCSALGLHLRDWEFCASLKYWLGIPMVPTDSLCSICNRSCDSFGDHFVECGGNGDRILRHNALRDAIFASACSSALSPKLEVPSLIPGGRSRPADIFLPCWKRGLPAALDVTVTSSLQAATVHLASTTQGHALQIAESRKNAAHDHQCRSEGISFIPLAVEVLGGWSPLACSTLKEMAHMRDSRLGTSNSSSLLFQKLSTVLWRCNASMWVARCRSLDSPI